MVKHLPAMQETLAQFLVRKICWRRDKLPTPVFLGFPGGSAGKEPACNVGDLGSTPGLGRSPGGGHDNPFQYSCLENPHGHRSLEGYSPWGHKESDTTEQLSTCDIQIGSCALLTFPHPFFPFFIFECVHVFWQYKIIQDHLVLSLCHP